MLVFPVTFFQQSGATLGGNSISYTLNTNGGGGNTGKTICSVIASAAFGGLSGTAVRVTFTGHSGSGMTIDRASIFQSAGAGDAYDGTGSAVALTFNGGSRSVTVAAGVPQASDTVAFVLDPTKDHIVSWTISAGDLRYKNSATANHRQFYRTGDEVDTADKTTGYSEDSTSEPYGLSLFEW